MVRVGRHVMLWLAVLAVATGCGGTASRGESATPTPIPTPIVPTKPTYVVQRGEVVSQLEFSGRVAPVVEEELFFRTSGYVQSVFVKRDDEVKEGDILAELEVTDLKNQLAQAEMALESAMASNAQQVSEAEASVRAAELRLEQLKASSPADQVLVASITLERAQLALSDTQKMYQEQKDRVWERDYDRLMEAAARQVHAAEQNVQLAEAGLRQARQAVASHSYSIEMQEQEVELARQRLERIKAGISVEEIRLTVTRLEAQLADARITSPIDGIVLSVGVVEGRMADAYRPIMVVADPSELEVSADVAETQLASLTEGMAAMAAPVNNPGQDIPAVIRRLPYPYGGGGGSSTGVGEQDKSTRVSLDMEGAGATLDLGDLVRVTVLLEQKDDVLWLPPQAVRTFEGRRFVVVQDGDAQRRVDVKLGIQGEDRVEIVEGLTEGQTIIGQ
ncbi:MAG: biotin/lipoyl-binding protein [Anaerolineales bacterium]|nr:biotin/lipoyl-binding protein [Anaerolineales bacterium]